MPKIISVKYTIPSPADLTTDPDFPDQSGGLLEWFGEWTSPQYGFRFLAVTENNVRSLPSSPPSMPSVRGIPVLTYDDGEVFRIHWVFPEASGGPYASGDFRVTFYRS